MRTNYEIVTLTYGAYNRYTVRWQENNTTYALCKNFGFKEDAQNWIDKQ